MKAFILVLMIWYPDGNLGWDSEYALKTYQSCMDAKEIVLRKVREMNPGADVDAQCIEFQKPEKI